VSTLLEREAWRSEARCASDLGFFDAPIVEQRRKCNVCPVRATCLAYALANKIEHGTWGGQSERQRRRIVSRKRPYPYTRLITLLRGAEPDLLRRAKERLP